MFGADVDVLQLEFEESFDLNVNDLQKLVKSNTKLIVLNTPNNPTGSIIRNSDMKDVVEIARKIDAYVLVDEVYRPLFHSVDPVVDELPKSIVELYEKGISTGPMSKAFSLPGARVGWIASKEKSFINECFSKRDFCIISVSALDDQVALFTLKHRDAIIKRNYRFQYMVTEFNLGSGEKKFKTNCIGLEKLFRYRESNPGLPGESGP
ncbi:unnamed protein product [Ambrosiozyma monospora]|uniref:Unnamed protein product n=1 Tax=Ambrosiozyma monospora TaxID=43982 RepID=A0ACB5SZR2_AMBMO|nr:unnamed protein product [Ambrosiozyma monospora]